jgi:hypothetical protein
MVVEHDVRLKKLVIVTGELNVVCDVFALYSIAYSEIVKEFVPNKNSE